MGYLALYSILNAINPAVTASFFCLPPGEQFHFNALLSLGAKSGPWARVLQSFHEAPDGLEKPLDDRPKYGT